MSNSKINKMSNLLLSLKQKCQEKDRLMARDLGISCPEFNCLSIFFLSGNHTVKDLAEKLNITPGGVTRIVTSLETKGYLKREISLQDRRNIIVSLTDAGKELVDKTSLALSDFYKKILVGVKHVDQEKIISGLEVLLYAWSANRSA